MKAAILAALCSTVAWAQTDVIGFAALSRDGAVRLRWTNPKVHSGVLILRATAPIAASPVNGVTYLQGATLGNATVAYVDSQSTASTFEDTGRVNGTAYHYRIHNLTDRTEYSSGNVPTSAGLTSTPTSGTGSAAR